MKFQRRIPFTSHSPTTYYIEMEEYTGTTPSLQSASIADGSISDLSEIGSLYNFAGIIRQRSDSLTNLFNLSEDSASVSNLSVASYSLSQHSCDYGSTTATTTIPSSSANSGGLDSNKISRKPFSSSYKNLYDKPSSTTSSRFSDCSSRHNNNFTSHYQTTNIQSNGSTNNYFCNTSLSGSSSSGSNINEYRKSFPSKTADSVLNTIGLGGINTTTSSGGGDIDATDKCGLISCADYADNELDDCDDFIENGVNNVDDLSSINDGGGAHSYYVDSSDENEQIQNISNVRHNSGTSANTTTGNNSATTSTKSLQKKSNGKLRKAMMNNVVDRLINSGKGVKC
ncbi:unnamed protein product [Didymodactylos carnosus]|uniref:Uncharacterized protein n=1 Tax=Didymodactylos carnosus TaxID=1234261 RepID=A0A813NY98_9BILA|nr:unnamed protein product [Didymodactylos carnosus]CAF0740675.1 unnamed protein product [Didymodactylos carnosus]CAF3497182.1 unnamed protein product [Didymodactylos carnosus]CAF3518941.1 unnamed protein product [Didymodactylos carnosus]